MLNEAGDKVWPQLSRETGWILNCKAIKVDLPKPTGAPCAQMLMIGCHGLLLGSCLGLPIYVIFPWLSFAMELLFTVCHSISQMCVHA